MAGSARAESLTEGLVKRRDAYIVVYPVSARSAAQDVVSQQRVRDGTYRVSRGCGVVT